MLSVKSIPSTVLMEIFEYVKLVKASHAVLLVFEPEALIIYATQDNMFSTINRMIVRNVYGITGTFASDGTKTIGPYSKTLIPFIDIDITPDGSIEDIQYDKVIENTFLLKRDRINSILVYGYKSITIDKEICESLKDKLLSMRADDGQFIFNLGDGLLITIYSGFIPVNKADTLNISILDGGSWYLCKYTVFKKKAPAPIDIFVKYKRL